VRRGAPSERARLRGVVGRGAPWVVPPGDYTVVVGESSRSLAPAGVVSVSG
jgi:hypothetical protein